MGEILTERLQEVRTMTNNYQPGRYLVRVIDQHFGESQRTGTPKFSLVVRVTRNLDNPDAYCAPVQKEIVWWITDKNVEWVMRDLQSLGYTGTTLYGVHPEERGFHDFRGQDIEVACVHEEDRDGRVWERWRPCAPTMNLKDKSKLCRLDRMLLGQAEVGTDGAWPDASDEEVPF
jgi:hypothetical protein